MAFAWPEIGKASAPPNYEYEIAEEVVKPFHDGIKAMLNTLKVESDTEAPKRVFMSAPALEIFNRWVSSMTKGVNRIESLVLRERFTGILGKQKEYLLRYACMLAVTDYTYNNAREKILIYPNEIEVGEDLVKRCIKLAEYYMASCLQCFEFVDGRNKHTPVEVMEMSNLLKSGKSYADIAKMKHGSSDPKFKQLIFRQVKKMKADHPDKFI